MQCAFELDGICYISSAVQYIAGEDCCRSMNLKLREEKREQKVRLEKSWGANECSGRERETPLKKSKSTDIENKLKCWAKGEKENSISISEREREV
jgi:hypothetical protein